MAEDRLYKAKGDEWVLFIAITFLSFLIVFLNRSIRLESQAAIIPGEHIFYIYEGGNVSELPELMKQNGFIFNETDFKWAADIFEITTYRPGRYVINAPVSYHKFLSRLHRGLQDPMMVTIGGGMEMDRFVQRVSNHFRFSADELRIAMVDTTLLNELEIKPSALIGRMLPNTYEMYWTASPEQFVRRMVNEFDRAVVQPHAQRALEVGLSIDEVATLASIIEWEVRHVEEKPRVSGLYWNRLNRRMLLQADPTVAYAIGERRRLFFSDYRVDHPYNTYRIRGLPPGPINNPRLTSIEAALYPESHNYIFMVATPEGYHAFTTNYQDHLRESRKWTNWLREQREIRARMEAETAAEQSRDSR